MMAQSKRNQKLDLRVGDRVRVNGLSGLVGTVVESQGHIGVGGRQIVRVRLELPEEEGGPMMTSATPDDVEVLAPAKAA